MSNPDMRAGRLATATADAMRTAAGNEAGMGGAFGFMGMGMADVYKRQEIAELLGISKRTVGFHITNMLEKTGHKSVVGLAVEAAEKGLTSAETQNECERDDTVFS